MSWPNELHHVFDLIKNQEKTIPISGIEAEKILPVSHSTANAQIEITLDEEGKFKGARAVPKDEALTVIPVTEDSGARGSGIFPMPFDDKLIYIAGDYAEYVEYKNGKDACREYHNAYIVQLKKWNESEYSHQAVRAVYQYVSKGRIMKDLILSSVLDVDSSSNMLKSNVKINGIAQEDAFVRFVVQYRDINEHNAYTWQDVSLQECFVNFNRELMDTVDLCYATGEILPVTYKHPSKIRNAGDKGRLISSNDESGFSYRGRFAGKEEALSVSYEFSQKMHNALKWLITTQGNNFGSLSLVIWASALEKIPNELDTHPIEDSWLEWDDEDTYDSLPAYKTWLSKYIFGYQQELRAQTKIMIMGLDAATTGRVSIALYDELAGSDFLNNLRNWHENTAWLRFDTMRKKMIVKSFSLYEIIRTAYGGEQNDRVVCDDKVMRDQMLRMLPCVMNGRQVPSDLIQTLYHKASSPLAYEKNYNHRMAVEVACGMIRAQKKGVIPVSYDPKETNRSYLYGCLLAIADKAESDTYEGDDKGKRVTNARRFWASFSQHPYSTWQNIEERLRTYLDRHPYRLTIERQIEEITEKMSAGDFKNNSRLEPLYLLGYHHYTAYMYKGKQKEEE